MRSLTRAMRCSVESLGAHQLVNGLGNLHESSWCQRVLIHQTLCSIHFTLINCYTRIDTGKVTSEVLDFPLFRCRTPLTPSGSSFRRRRRVSASWHCASRWGFLWGPSWEVSCLARPIGRLGRLGDGMFFFWLIGF